MRGQFGQLSEILSQTKILKRIRDGTQLGMHETLLQSPVQKKKGQSPNTEEDSRKRYLGEITST